MRLLSHILTAGLMATASFLAQAQDFYELTSPCNPVSIKTCALPFPSDVYAKPDPASPTGLRLHYPDGVVRPELLEEVPPTLTPEKVVANSTGYSAASGVLFELSEAPDPASLPVDGGDAVIVYNLTTGERVPVRATINTYAQSKRVAAPSYIVEIFPRSRWQFGHRHAVFLSNSLKPTSGGEFQPGDGFRRALSQDGTALSNYYEPVISFYEQHGFSRSQLLSATFFTVRTEEEATQKLKTLTDFVYQQDHPIRDIKIRYKLFGNIGAYVKGEVLVHNFRDDAGGMVYDIQQAKPEWVTFLMAIPRSAKKSPAPVSIFGHGIGFIKESAWPQAIRNARMGIATIAIDHPNHGPRIGDDGGWLLTRVDTPYVALQVGMMVQSSIDHMSLLKSITTHIGALDILPMRFPGPLVTNESHGGDGIPDLDTSTIFYQGISLGGVLGSAFVSLAPEIKGAIFQVAGVGITNILSGSALWNPVFSKLVPDVADGAEALVLKAAMQHEVDYGDAINFVHYLREPPAGIPAKPVLLVTAEGDGIVPNFSSVALSEIAGIPLIGDQHYPVPGSVQLTDYDNGWGHLQLPMKNSTGSAFLNELLVHFSSGRADDAMEAWVHRYILEDASK